MRQTVSIVYGSAIKLMQYLGCRVIVRDIVVINVRKKIKKTLINAFL